MLDVFNIQEIKFYLESHSFFVADIKPIINSGVSSNVFYLLMKDGSTKYLKISHDNKLDYSVQKFVVDTLISLGIKAPKIIYVEPLEGISGKHLLILEALEGVIATPLEIISNVDVISSQLSIINSFDIPGFGTIKYDNGSLSGEFNSYYDYFLNSFGEYTTFISPYINVNTDYFSKLLHKIEKLLLESKTLTRGRLVHRDIPGHIYIKNGEFTGIIDFDDIKSCTPFYDILKCHYSYPEDCSNLLTDVWKKKVDCSNYSKFYLLEHLLYLIEEMCNVTSTYIEFKDEKYNKANTYLKALDILIGSLD